MLSFKGVIISGKTAFIRFQLTNCGTDNPLVPGGRIASMTQDFHADSGGRVSGILYGNDAITCDGAPAVSAYLYSVFVGANQVGTTQCYVINSGTTFDVGNP